MVRSSVRAHVAANEPQLAGDADRPADQDSTDAAAPPVPNRPKLKHDRAPWLIRNSRKATIALVLTIIAASPFAYRYLYRNFGPDPLAGIKIDAVKFNPGSGAFEVVRPATEPHDVRSAGGNAAKAKPEAVARSTEFAPKPVPPKSLAAPAARTAAAPIAPSLGVTHTRSSVATPIRSEIGPPAAENPGARELDAKPPARGQRVAPGACNEAVAALGLCDSGAIAREK